MTRSNKEDDEIKNIYNNKKYAEFTELNDILSVFVLSLIHRFYWLEIAANKKKGTSTGLSVTKYIELTIRR